MFSRRDLGEGGVRFLRRVRESQMFCNYCHAQSLKRKALRVQTERHSMSLRARAITDFENSYDDTAQKYSNQNSNQNQGQNPNLSSKSENDPNSEGKGKGTGSGTIPWNGGRYSFNGTRTRQSSVSERMSIGPVEEEEDSLISLFKIMLTGTIPLKQSKMDLLLADN